MVLERVATLENFYQHFVFSIEDNSEQLNGNIQDIFLNMDESK